MNQRLLVISWVVATAAASLGSTGELRPLDELLRTSPVVSLEIHPERIEFHTRFEYAQLLLSARLENGQVVDITREAQLVGPSPLVDVSKQGHVTPLMDGTGSLRFQIQELSIEVPVTVSGQDEHFEPSFVQDVMPLISRLGCNAGTCHGAQQGKNGFKLSLRGYDPAFDHQALTDDLAGRRFNRVAPDESLFLRKPTAQVPHGGGQVLLPGSRRYDLLRGWVEGGVAFAAPPAELVSLRVLPQNPSIPLPDMQQQIAVLATYSDGSERDVTAEAFVESGDIEVTAVDDRGLVTALRRGESPILVRYEGHYAATRLVVMGDREGWEWEPVAPHNWIDTLVFEKLQRVKSQPSELCTDAEFLRRVSLDLAGLPPSPREVRTFLLDDRDSSTKRNELIDRLIGSPDFVDYWTNKWADLLQVNSKWLGAEGAERFRAWIRGAVASNRPYDRFVNDILRASGPTYDNPEASYFKILRKPDVVMENTTQLFLGVRFNCNKCHDHPFERWTQRDHWRMAAFFGQVGRVNVVGSPLMPGGGDNQPGEPPAAQEEIIYDAATGEVIDPRTGEIAIPTFPFEHAGTARGSSRRAQLA
ncbi:MAG: DUF1549 domain-containing protein, partial [Planctomycetota bacterium]